MVTHGGSRTALRRAPPFISRYVEGRPAATLHKTAGGSASPKGEARRERAGKAQRSDRRAREDYGWGWAGGVTKPNQAPIPATPHLTLAAHTGARKNPRHGATSNGSACRSGRKHLGAGTRQAEPRRARQSVVVAVLRIVTCDVDSTPYRGFFRAPPFISSYAKGRPRSPARTRRQGGAKRTPRLIAGLGKRARRGAPSNGSACKSGRMHLGAGTRQAEPRPARQSVVVAVLRIVTWGVDSAPHRALFPSPSIPIQLRKSASPPPPL